MRIKTLSLSLSCLSLFFFYRTFFSTSNQFSLILSLSLLFSHSVLLSHSLFSASLFSLPSLSCSFSRSVCLILFCLSLFISLSLSFFFAQINLAQPSLNLSLLLPEAHKCTSVSVQGEVKTAYFNSVRAQSHDDSQQR